MVVIKFKNRKEEIKGYYLLALNGVVRGLPGGLFEVNDNMLQYLDKEDIVYEIIKKDTLSEAEKIRNTPSIAL